MKVLMETIRALFITVIGGLLVLLFQDDVESLRYSGLYGKAISGPWAPHEIPKDLSKAVDLSNSSDLIGGNNRIALIKLENSGKYTVKKGKIVFKDAISHPDVLIYSKNQKKGKYFKEVESISLPYLDPGDEIYVFLWSSFGFGWPNFFDDVRTYSEFGPIPIELRTHIEDSGYGDSDRDQGFLKFLLSKWYVCIGVVSIVLTIAVFSADYMMNKYIKKLLLDDDFWLSEREKIEAVGHKNFIPTVSDLKIPEQKAT